MVKWTHIARVSDGLPLAATLDEQESDKADILKCKKTILQQLRTGNPETRCTIKSDYNNFHYIIEDGVVFICLCDRSYQRQLAFSYLEELAKEFKTNYGDSPKNPSLRPYKFPEFDTFMQKTKRIYEDSRTKSNLGRLNEDLQDLTRIMTKNMEDLINRGDNLEQMSQYSSDLKNSAKHFKDKARDLNWAALYRKYGPPAIVVTFLLLVFLIRYYWM